MITGWYRQTAGQPPVNRYRVGFLLEDKTPKEPEGDFTIFLLDLSTRTFRKTKPGTYEGRRVGYEATDLKTAADARLAELRIPREKRDPWRWLDEHLGERLSERGQTFVFARACAAHGLETSAHDLIAEAAKMPLLRTGKSPGTELLAAALSDDIAENRMWEAVVGFEDPSIGRKELLKRFRYIVAHFPESKYAAQAKKMPICWRGWSTKTRSTAGLP